MVAVICCMRHVMTRCTYACDQAGQTALMKAVYNTTSLHGYDVEQPRERYAALMRSVLVLYMSHVCHV